MSIWIPALHARSVLLFAPLAQPTSEPPSPWRNIEGDERDPYGYHPESNHRQKAENPQNHKHHPEHRSEPPGQMRSTPIRRPTQDMDEIRFELAYLKQSIHPIGVKSFVHQVSNDFSISSLEKIIGDDIRSDDAPVENVDVLCLIEAPGSNGRAILIKK